MHCFRKIILKIQNNLKIIKDYLDIESQSLIIPIIIGDNQRVLEIQKNLNALGFAVGAIRQPTVKKAIME